MSAIYTLYPTKLSEARRKRRTGRRREPAKDLMIDALHRFIISDFECVEVREMTGYHNNSNNLRKAFADTVKDEHMDIEVTIRGDKVYLIKGQRLLEADAMCKLMCPGPEEEV